MTLLLVQKRGVGGFISATFRLCSRVALTSLLLSTFLILLWPSSSSSSSSSRSRPLPLPLALVAWSLAQWTPSFKFSKDWQAKSWRAFDQQLHVPSGEYYVPPLPIPVIDFGDAKVIASESPLRYLEETYGTDWRERPLLLKGLWNASVLQQQEQDRRLSVHGLSQEHMTIPYFTDARVYGALTPDDHAPISQIIKGMLGEDDNDDNDNHDTNIASKPYSKIGSQLFVRANPSVLDEVAPMEIVNQLFGDGSNDDRFSKNRLLGHITSPWAFLKGPLTVPLFVANGGRRVVATRTSTKQDQEDESDSATTTSGEDATATSACKATTGGGGSSEDETATTTCNTFYSQKDDAATTSQTSSHDRPFTGLHCEPIGNVAVQLAGAKEWTLIDPQYSHLLRPSVSPDSRGYFASWASLEQIQRVPRYENVRTVGGDAMWVPTWTWHRVDYVAVEDNGDGGDRSSSTRDTSTIAIGASLFHFRPLDFLRRNPLYAILLLPYLIGEFVGSKSQ